MADACYFRTNIHRTYVLSNLNKDTDIHLLSLAEPYVPPHDVRSVGPYKGSRCSYGLRYPSRTSYASS